MILRFTAGAGGGCEWALDKIRRPSAKPVRRSAVMSTTAVPDGDPPCAGRERYAPVAPVRRRRPALVRTGNMRLKARVRVRKRLRVRACTRRTCGGFETGRGPKPEHREGPRGLSAQDAVKNIRGELPNDTRRAKAGDIFEIPPQRGRMYPAFLEKRGLLM